MVPTQPSDRTTERSSWTGIAATVYTIIVPGSLTLLVPWLLLRHSGWPLAERSPWQHAGWIAFIIGAVMVISCVRDFVVRGHGTPAPNAAPTALVVKGLYRWTRNPMYVGVLSMLLGEALLFWSRDVLWYAAGSWVCMHLFVLVYEEPTLTRRFGQAYADYRALVPRWLGWPRHSPEQAR